MQLTKGRGLADVSLPNPSCRMALGWTCVINEICFGLLPEPTFDCKFIHIQFFPLAQRTYRTRWRSDRTRTEMCSDPRDTRTYGESECVAGMFRSQFCSKIYWPYACNLDSKTEGEIICTEESHLPRRCRSKSGEHVSFDYWLWQRRRHEDLLADWILSLHFGTQERLFQQFIINDHRLYK